MSFYNVIPRVGHEALRGFHQFKGPPNCVGRSLQSLLIKSPKRLKYCQDAFFE